MQSDIFTKVAIFTIFQLHLAIGKRASVQIVLPVQSAIAEIRERTVAGNKAS